MGVGVGRELGIGIGSGNGSGKRERETYACKEDFNRKWKDELRCKLN